jgi:uncharacterized membrane protein required for colicin V production
MVSALRGLVQQHLVLLGWVAVAVAHIALYLRLGHQVVVALIQVRQGQQVQQDKVLQVALALHTQQLQVVAVVAVLLL